MKKSPKLETFLAMVEETICESPAHCYKDVILTQESGDEGELRTVKITSKFSFFSTEFIVMAEALGLCCYLSSYYGDYSITLNVFAHPKTTNNQQGGSEE